MNLRRTLIIGLAALVAVAVYSAGWTSLWQVMWAVMWSCGVDVLFRVVKKKQVVFPESSIIIGILVGGILADGTQWYWVAAVSAIAVLSKYLVTYNGGHFLNPANAGLVIAAAVGIGQNWWIEAAPVALTVLGFSVPVVVLAAYCVYRTKRIDLLLAYVCLETLLLSSMMPLVDAVRSIDPLFAGVMLIDPSTSPASRKGQVVYGVTAALAVYAMLAYAPTMQNTVAGLFTANLTLPAIRRFNL